VKCDRCDNIPIVHLTEVRDGKKIQQHLCADCAAKDYPTAKKGDINEILKQFVAKNSKLKKQIVGMLSCQVYCCPKKRRALSRFVAQPPTTANCRSDG